MSPGCKNCYAEELMDHRYGRVEWGEKGTRSVTAESNWFNPTKWDRLARRAGVRRRVFCASLADVFEQRTELNAPRRRLAKLIWETPNLDWLFLTKRIEHAETTLYDMWAPDAEWPRNFWVGASVEDQRRAEERIPHLQKLHGLTTYLSVEPLLEDIWFPSLGGIDWVIVGGESGHGARPCNINWIRSIRDQCRSAGVPLFIKQLGASPFSESQPLGLDRRGITLRSSIVLRDPKGGDPDEWPEDLRIREFPR